jgi:hypothetical protein
MLLKAEEITKIRIFSPKNRYGDGSAQKQLVCHAPAIGAHDALDGNTPSNPSERLVKARFDFCQHLSVARVQDRPESSEAADDYRNRSQSITFALWSDGLS